MKSSKLFAAILLSASLLVVPLLLAGPSLAGEVPKLIEYTGVLTKPTGPYLAGQYNITFSLCPDKDCTQILWSETHLVSLIPYVDKSAPPQVQNVQKPGAGAQTITGQPSEGNFTVLLGSITPLDLAFEQGYYLLSTEAAYGYRRVEQLFTDPYSMRSEFTNYADTIYDSNDGKYKNLQDIEINKANDADKVDGRHYSDIANKIDGDLKAHAETKTTHGVKGVIVGTTDDQELTNKHISGEQIDSGTINDARIPDDITINKARDSEKLGGQGPAYYAVATHAHSFGEIGGTVSDSQVPDDITINYAKKAGYADSAGSASSASSAGYANKAGYADSAGSASSASSAGNADTVDGRHATEFLDNSGSTQSKSGSLNIGGNLGIGITGPRAKLEVVHPSVAPDDSSTGIRVTRADDRNRWIQMRAGGSSVDLESRNTPLYINFGPCVHYGDCQNVYIAGAGGNVGIGTTAPNYTLHVNGSAGKPGGGTWSSASDARLKKDVKSLTGALDKLTQLQGVTFRWINPEEHENQSDILEGLIAQDVEKVFPAWVSEINPTGKDKEYFVGSEKVKAIQFPHSFNAYLIEAIKELKAQNEALKALFCQYHPDAELCP